MKRRRSEEPPEEDWFDPETNLQVGSWGYQVLYERARKLKKHPIGFAVPARQRRRRVAD